jgi:hypothetical protein
LASVHNNATIRTSGHSEDFNLKSRTFLSPVLAANAVVFLSGRQGDFHVFVSELKTCFALPKAIADFRLQEAEAHPHASSWVILPSG